MKFVFLYMQNNFRIKKDPFLSKQYIFSAIKKFFYGMVLF